MELYANARFLPMTGEHDTFEAMLIDGTGTIAFTGSLEDARAYANHLRDTTPDTALREIDCGGYTVMPGLIDPHSHFSGATQYFTAADLSGARDFDDVIRLLGEFAQRHHWMERHGHTPVDTGVILIGVGLDDNELAEGRMPDRRVLDRVSDTLPIVVNHVSGHNLSCNSRMLELVGITAQTPDPTGGRYLRDSSGAPDGRCVEPPAMSPIFTFIQVHQRFELRDLLGDMQDLYASNGITTLQDGATTAHDAARFADAAEHGDLRLDLVSYPMFGEDVDGVFRNYARFDGPTYRNHFRFGGRKLFMDGSPQARTAWLSEPYTPGPEGEGYRGHATVDMDAAYRFALAAIDEGHQLLCHCNGDAASDAYLDLYERALRDSTNPDKRRLRPVMVHCQFARRDQYERMRGLGMIPSIFVAHTWYWGDIHIANMGMDRAAEISRVRDALDLGLPFTFHTDSPVIEPNLFESVWCAATRVTKGGVQLDPAQRVGVYEGLKAITVNAAHQYGEESTKGTLTPGKLADLVILDRDPLACSLSPDSPDSLRRIGVLATIKTGKLAWQRQ